MSDRRGRRGRRQLGCRRVRTAAAVHAAAEVSTSGAPETRTFHHDLGDIEVYLEPHVPLATAVVVSATDVARALRSASAGSRLPGRSRRPQRERVSAATVRCSRSSNPGSLRERTSSCSPITMRRGSRRCSPTAVRSAARFVRGHGQPAPRGRVRGRLRAGGSARTRSPSPPPARPRPRADATRGPRPLDRGGWSWPKPTVATRRLARPVDVRARPRDRRVRSPRVIPGALLLALSSLVAAVVVAPAPSPPLVRPPNVLIVVTDDQPGTRFRCSSAPRHAVARVEAPDTSDRWIRFTNGS